MIMIWVPCWRISWSAIKLLWAKMVDQWLRHDTFTAVWCARCLYLSAKNWYMLFSVFILISDTLLEMISFSFFTLCSYNFGHDTYYTKIFKPYSFLWLFSIFQQYFYDLSKVSSKCKNIQKCKMTPSCGAGAHWKMTQEIERDSENCFLQMFDHSRKAT